MAANIKSDIDLTLTEYMSKYEDLFLEYDKEAADAYLKARWEWMHAKGEDVAQAWRKGVEAFEKMKHKFPMLSQQVN